MNARCEDCLKRDGWAMPIGNIYLVKRNGKETLLCRPCKRGEKRLEPKHEPASVKN